MSVNRAGEVWKEIKPFALRDLGAVDSKSTGGGAGVGGYFIILYDVSTKKLRYYSASADGLKGALAAASSGDIVFLPACTIVPQAATTYEVRDELSSGAIDVTAEAGVEISGLTVGKWYAVEANNGPYIYIPTPTYEEYYFSLSNGSGFQGAIGLGTDYLGTRFYLIWPDFCAFAEAVDDKYGRVYFKATTTSIYIRVTFGNYYDNVGTLGYSLKNAICAGPTTIPAGVEVVGMGENCILDGSVENNGMLTGVKVTGEITGTGSYHVFDSGSAWATNKQIKSSEAVASPFAVASSVVNTNLNADLLDGNHASGFVLAGSGYVAAAIVEAVNKTTLVDNDLFGVVDSEDFDLLKNITVSGLKLTLKTYFDTIYTSIAAGGLPVEINSTPTSTTSNNSGTSMTFSHTVVSGANQFLLVGWSGQNNSTIVNSMAYNGVALTKIDSVGGDSVGRSELWYLLDPPVGIFDIVVTMSGTVQGECGAVVFSNVNQTTPYTSLVSGLAINTINVTPFDLNSCLVGMLSMWNNAGSDLDNSVGQTTIWNETSDGSWRGRCSLKTGEGSITDLTWDALTTYSAILALSINSA